MKSNEVAHPKSASQVGPVGLLAAAGAAGLWLWQTPGTYVPFGPAVGLLTLTAVLGMVWLYRVRAVQRLFATLDAYAAEELVRAVRRPAKPSRTTRRGVSRRPV